MTRSKLLLVYPPVIARSPIWRTTYKNKQHLLSLTAYVRDVADVELVELDQLMGPPPAQVVPETVEAFFAGIDEHLALDGVDLVGISCWTSQHYLSSLAIARRVRALAPAVPIVVGGHHVTCMPSDFVTPEGLFDVVVRGDGEHALRTLCEERPKRLPTPRVVTGTPFELTDPSYIDWANLAWEDEDNRELALELSRGCPFSCSFCVEPQHGSRWSAYAVEDALAILERLAATHAPRGISLLDPLFGANREWTQRLVDGLAERDLGFGLVAQTRSNLMTRELLDGFERCGFSYVAFGLETGSPEMVVRMQKSRAPEAYLERSRECFQHCNRIGLPHLVGLLFNHPGETPDTLRETFDYVEALGAGRGPLSGHITANSFFLVPGSAVYRDMARYEQECGTRFGHPGWWYEIGDQFSMAASLMPSEAFRAHPELTGSFFPWLVELNVLWAERHPASISAFTDAFVGRYRSP